jgi:hypothetical protein
MVGWLWRLVSTRSTGVQISLTVPSIFSRVTRVCPATESGHYRDMGRYDAVHTGSRCGQVKCLGKGFHDLVIGDTAVLHVIPYGTHAQDLFAAAADFTEAGGKGYDPENPIWRLYDGEVSDLTSWQIKTQTGYIKFIDGVFTSWDDVPTDGVVVVENGGRDIDVATAIVGDDVRLGWGLPSDVEECSVCAQLANGIDPREWRAEQAEQAVTAQAEYELSQAAGLYNFEEVLEAEEWVEGDITLAMLLGDEPFPEEDSSNVEPLTSPTLTTTRAPVVIVTSDKEFRAALSPDRSTS